MNTTPDILNASTGALHNHVALVIYTLVRVSIDMKKISISF